MDSPKTDGSAAGSCSPSRSAAIGSGRTPPCWSRRRATLGKAGSSMSARESARLGSALVERSPLASADLVEIDPEVARARREQRGAQRTSGAHAYLAARRAQPEGAQRGGAGRRGGRLRGYKSAILRGQGGSRLTRREQSASACLGPGRRRRKPRGLDSASLAILAPGGRFVMIHRPDALRAILDAIGGRLGALALLPVHPRAGASAHGLLVSGMKGYQGPAAHRVRIGLARRRWPVDSRSRRHPSRGAAHRLGRLNSLNLDMLVLYISPRSEHASRFGFSWPGGFAAKAAANRYWIVLDFLRFPRLKSHLINGLQRISAGRFSRALCAALDIRSASGLSVRKADLFIA